MVIPTLEQFTTIMTDLGIGIDTSVVCFDNERSIYAAWVAYLLHQFGVREVLILNGRYRLPTVVEPKGTLFKFKPFISIN